MEALRRIISTLANKNEELQTFLETVDTTLTGLQEESWKVTSELEAELERLSSALEEKGVELRGAIKEEKQRKEAELQKQLSEGKFALLSCEELLEFANQTLNITNEEEFLKAAKQIKERVTMAPAFRLTTRPAVSENMSQFTVDFSVERAGLQRLHFLPVPRAPEIDASSCVVRDNAVTVAWQPSSEVIVDGDSGSGGGGGGGGGGRIERYELEYRKTNKDSSLRAAGEACWEKIHDIRETQVTVTGLKFDSRFVVVRVRARNKAAAGEFSEPVAIETIAYNFGFDAATAHPELKVQGDTVTWEPQGVKGHDPRLKGKENKSSSRSATPSPNKTAGSRAGRDRFAGESYTVLGDQEMSGGCHYWELRPLADWKSFSVGVAYRASLGRFDQLGKNAGSWCLHASQWLQSSLAAKHNNRAKALDWPLPQRIGIYCNYDNGDLSFIDVDRLRLLHSFKTKFSQTLVPAFTVWCGGISVTTGLQVPSFMGKFLSTNRSLSNLSQ
ncbi:FSD1-like protein isoform X5 [Thunnus maccoyii]|uniref:FSD1-like protein isoform X3 n=1 Tax=Thunnus maccoyii TaxID=8240 RepID=UPI001C4AA7FB|nr:FSD1-like protein isoform X3 [Thunnus maccoyii]XP_042252185.1 FSD1-like protein isoform X4 [Thunnus maccoyii]XP_042252186.1 FSD1-like protein isoform X5 [Thunnus maccoyii]